MTDTHWTDQEHEFTNGQGGTVAISIDPSGVVTGAVLMRPPFGIDWAKDEHPRPLPVEHATSDQQWDCPDCGSHWYADDTRNPGRRKPVYYWRRAR